MENFGNIYNWLIILHCNLRAQTVLRGVVAPCYQHDNKVPQLYAALRQIALVNSNYWIAAICFIETRSYLTNIIY